MSQVVIPSEARNLHFLSGHRTFLLQSSIAPGGPHFPGSVIDTTDTQDESNSPERRRSTIDRAAHTPPHRLSAGTNFKMRRNIAAGLGQFPSDRPHTPPRFGYRQGSVRG